MKLGRKSSKSFEINTDLIEQIISEETKAIMPVHLYGNPCNMDLIMKVVKGIYLKHTKFTEDELNTLLKRDLYLNAEDAIKYGLADEII